MRRDWSALSFVLASPVDLDLSRVGGSFRVLKRRLRTWGTEAGATGLPAILSIAIPVSRMRLSYSTSSSLKASRSIGKPPSCIAITMGMISMSISKVSQRPCSTNRFFIGPHTRSVASASRAE